MASLRGQLISTSGGTFRGHSVVVDFIEDARVDQNTAMWVPAGRRADVGDDGTFVLVLPESHAAKGPWLVTVAAPDGSILARQAYDAQPTSVNLPVEPRPRVVIEPSADPLLGKRARGTGRVLDGGGARDATNLQVVLWATRVASDAASPSEPAIVAVCRTDAHGYFAFDYPAGRFASAHGVVGLGGGVLVPIPLTGDAFPRKVVLVVTMPDAEPAAGSDCDCAPAPPRAPDPLDVVSSPEAYSSDVGGRCVDFTVPNRAIEEFSFYTVVRTTEPAIQGLTITDGRKPLRPELLGAITSLVTARARSSDERRQQRHEDRISPDALARLGDDANGFTLAELTAAADLTAIDDVHHLLEFARRPAPARAPLTAANPVDWDAEPHFYQAATIAHGHLLHFKQVWRADGYSLGDLLYSLPLAPCQKKQIAVLDWERREVGERTEDRVVREDLEALVSRDRDISEIVQSTLTESLRGASAAATFGLSSIIKKGLGVLGLGVAGSAATQSSARSLSASTLQQIRDRTLQAASSVRSQRSTVVQSVTQGETVRAQTEVIANHNHCHAITVQYFEVLRHFLVTQELADVQECLFIPLFLSRFDAAKALRWRTPLVRALQDATLRRGFDALERMRNNWVDSDLPTGRYSDENLEELSGEFRVSFVIPRPRDSDDGHFSDTAWSTYRPFLFADPLTIFNEFLFPFAAQERDRAFQQRIAPRIVRAFLDRLTFHFIGATGDEQQIQLDPTMVSTYTTDTQLLVTVRPAGALPGWSRDRVRAFEIRAAVDLPTGSRVIVHSGTARYRTAHFSHTLFDERRILNDLLVADPVRITTWPDRDEQRNPRAEDREVARRLIAHLNEHLEHYHKVIWWTMDPDRRYMLLDGFIAPNSGGRSVASVVDNRLIGVVGNCLVMPVAPGIQLDPTYRQDVERPVELIHHYAPTTPPAPMRISVPTRGVFAEAVMGACNSCEEKDDSRFWRFEESPCGDEPTPILPVSTESRRAEPGSLQPQDLPAPIVNVQNAPAAPDPTGLASALQVLGTANLFRDVTGLAQNQQNALVSLAMTQDTLRHMITASSALAKEKNAQQNLPSAMQTLYQAMKKGVVDDAQGKTLAEGFFKAAGAGGDDERRVTDEPEIKQLLGRDGVTSVTYSRPPEFLAASYQAEPEVIDHGDVTPPTGPDGEPIETGDDSVADVAYGGYDLRRNDRDNKRRWGGEVRNGADENGNTPPRGADYVRQLQRDLRKLGITAVTESGVFDAVTEWSVREFQIYAGMANIAQLTSAAMGASPPERYRDRLQQVANTDVYTGPVSGVVNGETRIVLQVWLAYSYRIPVVVEVWRVDGAARRGTTPRVGNLWKHNGHTDAADRMFVTDLSEYYGTGIIDTQPLGDYVPYGPRSVPPYQTQSEVLPLPLVGVAWSSMTPEQQSTFVVSRAVAEVECYGFFDGINAWDDQTVSIPLFHATLATPGEKGELGAALAYLEEARPAGFETAFGRFGLRAAVRWGGSGAGLLSSGGARRFAAKVALDDESGTHDVTERDEYNYLRSWHWIYRWVMAGRAVADYQRGLYEFARHRLHALLESEWPASLHFDNGTRRAATLGDVFTSERAVALLLRWHVNMPAQVINAGLVAKPIRDALANARGTAAGDFSGTNVAQWTATDEQALVAGILQAALDTPGAPSDATMKNVANFPTWSAGLNPYGYTLPTSIPALSTARGSFRLDPP